MTPFASPLPVDISATRQVSDSSVPVGGLRRGPRTGRAAGTLAALAAAAVAALSLGAAPSLADTCPNAALRAQNHSTGLPDCRAYEMVTPPYKEGFPPTAEAYTDDGAFGYSSTGNFAGNGLGGVANAYVARRFAAGWQTVSYSPSGPTYDGSSSGTWYGFSADLRSSLFGMRRAEETTDVSDFYLRGPNGVFSLVGPSADHATLPPGSPGTGQNGGNTLLLGASADLSHIMFDGLLEYVGLGNESPRMVGVDSDGHQISACGTMAGSAMSLYNAMSKDGQVIFFSPQGCASGPPATEVWASVEGPTGAFKSYQASASLCTRSSGDPGGVCNGPADATFQGADAEGSRVFFTTSQQLVNGDIDATDDLYEYDVPSTGSASGTLRQVSGSATDDGSVQGVTRISDDGSRVYFVATGALAANLGANNAAAIAGDDNLYVWRQDAAHPVGQTTFVAKLASNDSGLWGTEANGASAKSAQTTDDGRYLVLSTASPLVDSGPSADTDTAADVYRYDAESGVFVRLSIAAAGGGGNGDGFNATLSVNTYSSASATSRARTVMTADGGAVVFLTSEALAASDINGTVDAYEWHDGQVSLISGGRPVLPVLLPLLVWISSSGEDIYFSTVERLTPDDGDTQTDVYDARVGGGFDFSEPVPCSGDGCQGDHDGGPGSSAVASDAPSGQSDVAPVAPAFSLRAVSVAQRLRLVKTGKLTLTLTPNSASTLSANATATIARRSSVSVASARRTVVKGGTTSVVLTLSRKARAQLAADGRLTVKIVVSSSVVAVGRSVTLKLTQTKAKKSTRWATKTSSVKRAATAGLKDQS